MDQFCVETICKMILFSGWLGKLNACLKGNKIKLCQIYLFDHFFLKKIPSTWQSQVLLFFYEKMDFSQVVFMTKGFLAFHELTPQLEERILDIPNLKSLVLSPQCCKHWKKSAIFFDLGKQQKCVQLRSEMLKP